MLSDYFFIDFFLARNDKEDEFCNSNKAEIPGSPLTVSYFYLSVPCVLSYTICERKNYIDLSNYKLNFMSNQLNLF